MGESPQILDQTCSVVSVSLEKTLEGLSSSVVAIAQHHSSTSVWVSAPFPLPSTQNMHNRQIINLCPYHEPCLTNEMDAALDKTKHVKFSDNKERFDLILDTNIIYQFLFSSYSQLTALTLLSRTARVT